MSDFCRAKVATAILRLTVGSVMLAHSVILKLFTYGMKGTAAFFIAQGLPGWLAYVTFAVEVTGGVLLIIGIRVREASLILLPFMLGALFTVHLENGWVFNASGGGWEYPAVLAILCLVLVLLGRGSGGLVSGKHPVHPLSVH